MKFNFRRKPDKIESKNYHMKILVGILFKIFNTAYFLRALLISKDNSTMLDTFLYIIECSYLRIITFPSKILTREILINKIGEMAKNL